MKKILSIASIYALTALSPVLAQVHIPLTQQEAIPVPVQLDSYGYGASSSSLRLTEYPMTVAEPEPVMPASAPMFIPAEPHVYAEPNYALSPTYPTLEPTYNSYFPQSDPRYHVSNPDPVEYHPPLRSDPIGTHTRNILAMQADASRQANALPMLGATANSSWERYTKSFNTTLPEWFEEKVENSFDN